MFYFSLAVAETTAELCIAGTRKSPIYTPPSSNHLTGTAASNARRSHLSSSSNRIQPASNYLYETNLPFIRDANGHVDGQNPTRYYSRPKTPLIDASPNSLSRPPSGSMSSIFNALAKRSSENFTTATGDQEETINLHPVPPSRRSQRPHKGTGLNQNVARQVPLSHKPSGDSGIDIHYSTSSADANQQQRALAMSTRMRTNVPQIHADPSFLQETVTRERTGFGMSFIELHCLNEIFLGSLYQRRQNPSIKTSTKQKIEKYRRRSEEVTQAMNGTNPPNNGITTTAYLTSARPKPPSSPAAAVRRVSAGGEMQARMEVLRLSMEPNTMQIDRLRQSQSRHRTRRRIKSPQLYSNQQSTKPTTPTSNPPTPSARLRPSHKPTQTASSVNSSQHQRTHSNDRRAPIQNAIKPPVNSSNSNLYLAFVASRHLSTLEDVLFECDIDHQKLLRIFTWLKGVEDHRHEQSDHDQLLIEQNQRMLDQEENFSLYSEIQQAVDEVPANTTGKPCEKIVTMQFED